MPVLYLRGDGKISRRTFLADFERHSWPDHVHDDDGRAALLLLPGRAAWRRGLFRQTEDALFTRRDAYVARKAAWADRKGKVEASTKSAEQLAPHRDWLEREAGALKQESADCRAAFEEHQLLCVAFMAATQEAISDFWTPQEVSDWHGCRTVHVLPAPVSAPEPNVWAAFPEGAGYVTKGIGTMGAYVALDDESGMTMEEKCQHRAQMMAILPRAIAAAKRKQGDRKSGQVDLFEAMLASQE